jgi:ABC-type antimicrobial peptide transport system permease subunit
MKTTDMKIMLGILFLLIGIPVLVYTYVNNDKLLKEFKEMKSDLGVSYYKFWFAGIFFTVAGILLLLNLI